MRRLTHYDYWQDRLRRCILCDSGADLLSYGMGEKTIIRIAEELDAGKKVSDLKDLPQTVFLARKEDIPGGIVSDDIVLHSHEECLQNKKAEAENYRHIEEESNKMHAQRLIQQVGNMYAVVNPPYPPMTTEELDASFDLPYTRLPHTRLRDDKALGKPSSRMFRRLRLLHHLCPSGKVRGVPF